MSRFPLPTAFLLAGLTLAPGEAEAQAVTPVAPKAVTAPAASAPENVSAVLTLKERLGAKWKDEQRVNNCNVPLEKRGPKPRSDACAHARPE